MQRVNRLSKSIWRAFFVPGNRKEVKKRENLLHSLEPGGVRTIVCASNPDDNNLT